MDYLWHSPSIPKNQIFQFFLLAKDFPCEGSNKMHFNIIRISVVKQISYLTPNMIVSIWSYSFLANEHSNTFPIQEHCPYMLVVFASHKIDSVVWFMLILYLCYCLGSNCWLKHKFACKYSSKNWRGAIAWQAALDINFPFITPSQLYQCCCLHSSTRCYAANSTRCACKIHSFGNKYTIVLSIHIFQSTAFSYGTGTIAHAQMDSGQK